MQITELCKKCGVTKKAVEYYCKKGLLQPQIMENGYRVFTDADKKHLLKSKHCACLACPFLRFAKF